MSIHGSEVDSRWYVSVYVPTRLQGVVGAKTITRTLSGTRQDAERYGWVLRADVRAGRIEARRGPLPPRRPLSIGPVFAFLADARCSRALGGCRTLGCNLAIAEAIGTSRRQVQRWKLIGLRLDDADRIAVELGAHPGDIWGYDVWADACDEVDAFLDGRIAA